MAPIAGVVWGKRRTLELYLNIIEWGEGVYGIEAASQFYFKRSVRQLSLQQAAALASVLPSPRRLSPNDLSEVSRQRYERIVKEANAVPLPTSFYTQVSAKRRARL
jgi:monofunctional biosynthetic peptidoglycan transglycosylase